MKENSSRYDSGKNENMTDRRCHTPASEAHGVGDWEILAARACARISGGGVAGG